MAKKASKKPTAGNRIRVKSGVTVPEVPDFAIEGWTGTITETAGKKSDPKYMIEWDAATIDNMPQEFLDRCEEKQLFYKMACLKRDDFDVVDG